MSLNKIIAEVTDANDEDGVINRHAAVNDAVPLVLADKELNELCVRSYLSRIIADNSRKRRRAFAEDDVRQASFFGLREHHVVADDAEGQIKHTSALSRPEFDGLIIVRQNQVTADLAYLSKLREARRLTADIWSLPPDWTWGEVETAFAAIQNAAA